MKKYKICVIGAGHVGLVAAASFSELGHRVICVDSDKKKIEGLKKLIVPFYEPDLEKLVRENTKKKNLLFMPSLDEGIKKSDVVFIAVGTPPQPDGSADLTSIEDVAHRIAKNLVSYKLIVEKSTVPVQTGQKIKETIQRYKKNTTHFDVASNPEFLREGKAVYDFFHPDRIVIGVESRRAENILKEIYHSLKASIIVTDINTAELIKHASNSFLATKISFINAVSRICDCAGADVEKVAEAMGMDERIGNQFLQTGVGYGGFCFPKDLEAFLYISKKLGYDFGLLREVKKINEEQRVYFVEKIKEHLWVIKDKRIGILGLSFKPNTDDIRFAPSLDIIRLLLEEGARLTLYDPQVKKERVFWSLRSQKEKSSSEETIAQIKFAKTPYEAVKGCDCACFITEWDELKKIDFKKIKELMHYPLIADGRNMFTPQVLGKMGFKYIGIGRV
ncbi:MAG: UDP-glucose/GDP-mannose dehydrogenase family protein [Candidatus Omnitrophota bacterium]|nr:MAG: UDP-glucose/GDP-mannose dehydrogenase family protein [Candidatus Omnitrophota bacterium]